ncbi:MAG TPA: response regulator [Candidatus Binataceae bacterium]|nr:response regulator [Candidatus Binataceae bacterium]
MSAPTKPAATILVVDDDASILRAMHRLLISVGFQVLTFDSSEALLAAELPSGDLCLLTDIYLPGANGTELSRALNDSGRKVPVILMTARTDGHTRKLADTVAAVATLYKPFDEDALLEAINDALGSS